MTEVIGWVSACILIGTIAVQIARQYRARSIEGVSPWLYVGQGTASSGLLVYSVLSRSWVFVALNAVMAMAAAVGLALWLHLRRRTGAGTAGASKPA